MSQELDKFETVLLNKHAKGSVKSGCTPRTRIMDDHEKLITIHFFCVQYQVIREKVYQAFYSLTDTRQQITAHVYDVLRSQLPTLELDAVFEAKEDLALVRIVRCVAGSFVSVTRFSPC